MICRYALREFSIYYDTYTYIDCTVLYKSLPDRRLPIMGSWRYLKHINT